MTDRAQRITDLRKILCRLLHIPIFVLPLQIGGAEDDVIMDVMLVDVRRHNVGELIVGHPGRQLISDLVCYLRRDLLRLESLPDMIGNHFVILRSSGVLLVLLAEKHELIRRRFGRAGVSRNQNSAVRLFRIHDVVQPVTNTLPGRFPFIDMNGYDASSCHGYSFQC